MSKFRLFESEEESLQQLILKNKIFDIVLIIVAVMYVPVSLLIRYETFFFILLIIIWLLLIISLTLLSWYINRQLKISGEINISLKSITNSIDGSVTTFDYEKIKEIDIKTFTKKIFFPANKDGSRTYLLTIVNDDLKTVKFVVACQSDDKPKVDLKETLKNLQKHVKVNVKGIK
jgi:hypothetical protein